MNPISKELEGKILTISQIETAVQIAAWALRHNEGVVPAALDRILRKFKRASRPYFSLEGSDGPAFKGLGVRFYKMLRKVLVPEDWTINIDDLCIDVTVTLLMEYGADATPEDLERDKTPALPAKRRAPRVPVTRQGKPVGTGESSDLVIDNPPKEKTPATKIATPVRKIGKKVGKTRKKAAKKAAKKVAKKPAKKKTKSKKA